MRLIVVRHGQTACNVSDTWHGWHDCPLTDTGRAQAEATADRLAGEHIDVIYSSDTQRARETAQAIARRHDLEVHTDPDLRERHIGEFEGLTTAQVQERYPELYESRPRDYWGWRPPGGETFTEMLERVGRAIDRIYRKHPDETVVVVTHMGGVRLLLHHLGGITLEETYAMEFPSTAITIARIDDEGAILEAINDAEHIAAL